MEAKKNTIKLYLGIIALFSAEGSFAQIQSDSTLNLKPDSLIHRTENNKEEKERNVMLNAANNTGPRDVNIGLPASVGGTTILENGMPVVHTFWPEMPNRPWRQSVSLGRPGLMKLGEAAITQGELGFVVNSYTRLGTKKTEVLGNFSTSSFGWIKTDMNISGPLGNNWFYTAGGYVNFDPQSVNLDFTHWADRTQIYRAGVTKKFNNGKGDISLLYKYSNSASASSSAIFRYKENGKAEEIDGFRVGRDSYVLTSGLFKYLDSKTGEYKWADLGGKDNESISHNLDLLGNYQFDSGWKLDYMVRGRYSEAVVFNVIGLGMTNATATAGFTDKDNGAEYAGQANTMLMSYTPAVPIKTVMARVELTKRFRNHNLRIGLTESYYDVDNFVNNRSSFYQTVEASPRQLLRSGVTSGNTDSDGFYNYNIGSEHHNGFDNKLATYFSDDWKISEKLSISYGLNLRWQKLKGDHYLTPRKPGFVLADGERTYFDNNWFHVSGDINSTYKITRDFGLLGELLYTETNGLLTSYSGNVTPNLPKTKSPMAAFGIYYNHSLFSMVAQASYLTRNNYLQRMNLVNPDNSSQVENVTLYYDIQTVGVTADIIAKPFKGFQIHYLFTYQNPVYKNFDFTAFSNNYSYNDKVVQGISKVLMEIDPSYTFNKFRVWASFRYFGKQYANLTNVLYFAPRWETFGGANYKINSRFDLGLTVVNFLNQRGVRGNISGAELITDSAPYNDKIMVGSYIRPFTVEASFNIKF